MVATKPISVEEFEAMPLEGTWELVDGEMVELTPSANRSGWIAGQIAFLLEAHVRATNAGWVFPAEVGFILFDDRATVRSPDAAFVRRDRLPDLTDSFVPVAPDLAVEVLSPTDRMADALGKVSMYLQAGVQLVWLVNPAEQSVTVFRPDASPKSVQAPGTIFGEPVLPGFSVPVADFFAEK